MTDDLKTKVTNVLELLSAHEYRVPSTGIKVPGSTQVVGVELINASRKSRRINVMMHAPNYNTYVNHPDRAVPGFKKELTHSFGLSDLGFDDGIWDEEDIVRQVETAIKGGVLTTVASRPSNNTLLELRPALLKGFAFPETAARALPRFHNIREFTVHGGDHLHCAATMPFDGYLRVVTSQDGEFIGLNRYMEIPTDHFDAGRHILKTVPTDPIVPRTFVFAFASAEWVFGKWPTDDAKKSRLSHGAFQQLVDAFFVRNHEHSSSVQSFVTTVAVDD